MVDNLHQVVTIINQMVERSPFQTRGANLNRVFHALADPTRREILRRVAVREHTVTELAEPFAMSLAAVSKHIKVLERAELLRQTRAGRIHRCTFNPEPLKDAAELIGYLKRFWNDRLATLEQFLVDGKDSK